MVGSWGRGQTWGAAQGSVRQASEPERAGRDIGRDGMLGRQHRKCPPPVVDPPLCGRPLCIPPQTKHSHTQKVTRSSQQLGQGLMLQGLISGCTALLYYTYKWCPLKLCLRRPYNLTFWAEIILSIKTRLARGEETFIELCRGPTESTLGSQGF